MVQELQKAGQNVALRSRQENLKPGTNIYVVDTLGLYFLSPLLLLLSFTFSLQCMFTSVKSALRIESISPMLLYLKTPF